MRFRLTRGDGACEASVPGRVRILLRVVHRKHREREAVACEVVAFNTLPLGEDE